MKVPNSKVKTAILLLFLIPLGLSMVAGPCEADPTPTPTGLPRAEPTPVWAPTLIPYTPTKTPSTPVATTEPTTPTRQSPEVPTLTTERESETVQQDQVEVPTRTPQPGEEPAQSKEYSKEPREITATFLSTTNITPSAYDNLTEPSTVEEIMENGAFAAETSPSHIALEGVPDP